MTQLYIYRCKPNPSGKDKNRNYPIASQLQAEWVDILNTGYQTVNFTGVTLYHTAYGLHCSAPKTEPYWYGSHLITLGPKEVLRVHTGKYEDRSQMRNEDDQGANWHVWANKGSFVLNNDCGDTLSLGLNGTLYDSASYDPRPPEGVVLTRNGSKLSYSLSAVFR